MARKGKEEVEYMKKNLEVLRRFRFRKLKLKLKLRRVERTQTTFPQLPISTISLFS